MEYNVHKGDKIPQLIIEKALSPVINIINKLHNIATHTQDPNIVDNIIPTLN